MNCQWLTAAPADISSRELNGSTSGEFVFINVLKSYPGNHLGSAYPNSSLKSAPYFLKFITPVTYLPTLNPLKVP